MPIENRTTASSNHIDSRLVRYRTNLLVASAATLVFLLTAACAEADDPQPAAPATSIATVVPTSTIAVAPTAVPTATLVPLPTATNTPAPTAVAAADPTSTATTVPVQPTSTVTPSPTSPPQSTNTPTQTPPATTSSPPAPTSAPAAPTQTPGVVINQERADQGEDIYSSNCSGCHSQGSNKVVGPGHANVYETAKTRVPGLSPEGYLMQSITDSTAFVVPGFSPIMPSFSFFSDEQILALVEFLKTL